MKESSSEPQSHSSNPADNTASLADGLKSVLESAKGDKVEMRQFFDCFQEKGFGILLMIFALPSALPLPAPGYSAPFGVILALLARQMLIGRHTPWLPEKMLRISFSRSFLEKIIPSAVAFLSKTEALVRPRMEMFTGRGMQVLPLFIVLLMSIFMMIPIPGTNTAPAMVVFMIGLGLSEKDGAVLLLSSLAGLCAAVLTSLILYKAILKLLG